MMTPYHLTTEYLLHRMVMTKNRKKLKEPQMTIEQQDKLNSVSSNIEFLASMILAWDTDAIEIRNVEKDGIWYILDCIRKELISIQS